MVLRRLATMVLTMLFVAIFAVFPVNLEANPKKALAC